MIDFITAIKSLHPSASFSSGEDIASIEWYSTDITQPTEEEINAKIAELVAAEPLKKLRAERTKRLAETDWWVLPDRTATQAQLDYRQALRDITDTYTSLDDVVWPTKP